MPDFPQTREMDAHRYTVSSLSSQVAKFHRSQIPFRIYHGNTNATRTSARTLANTLDVSSLNHVLAVSPSKRTCLVEPNVSMEELLSATSKHGLMPPVVPEFRKITVGGAYSGTAGESSCFKHGFFDRSAKWLEMILANGEVVTASENEREDLFRGAAGTFGTLGVTTSFELRLIEAKRFVELTYLPVKNIQHAVDEIEDAMAKDISGENPIDFLDGIMFSPNSGVVMSGKMIESPQKTTTLKESPPDNQQITTFHKPWDQWFYLRAQAQSQHSKPATDIIPLDSYIFRYDRGAFWMGKHAYSYFMVPFNRLTRFLLNPFMHTGIMYHALHRSGLTSTFIIQDMAVPAQKMSEFSDWLDSNDKEGGKCVDIYPRWLCPLREGEYGGMNPHVTPPSTPSSPNAFLPQSNDYFGKKRDFLLNIGLWGPLPSSHSATSQLSINRAIEAKLAALGGMKWLYAQTFYTEDEFWKIYDKVWYGGLRKKYRAETLPDVYTKVGPRPEALRPREKSEMGWKEWCWETIWPLKGLYGVASAAKGGDYLRKKQ